MCSCAKIRLLSAGGDDATRLTEESSRGEGDSETVTGSARRRNSSGVRSSPSSSYSPEGREKENVGVGIVDLLIAVTAVPGLGNVGIVNVLALLSPRGRESLGGEAVKEKLLVLVSRSCTKLLRKSVGELRVREARSVVGMSLTSGANVDELGGRGSARFLEKSSSVSSVPASFPCSGGSSAISAIEGLGDTLREPMIVGERDIRTQF